MQQQIILYGAGKNARNVLSAIQSDFVPVCFADCDNGKQGTRFEGTQYAIMPPEDAKKKFPKSKWIITIFNRELRFEIQEELIKNGLAEKEDIVNPLTKRWSCYLIETTISPFYEQDIMFCRGGRFVSMKDMPSCRWGENAEETIDEFLTMRDNMISQLNTDVENSKCYGCSLLKSAIYEQTTYKIVDCVYSTTSKSVCNFKCNYCYSDKYGNKALQDSSKRCSFNELVTALEQKNLISSSWTTLHFSSGEITIDPNRKNLYNMARIYNSIFYTNGSIYSSEIDSLLKSKKAAICVSVDSGTESTFLKIKHVNAFNKVCDNLAKYATCGGNEKIYLKYIFIPDINDNNDDFDGFAELCKKINPYLVIIASDANMELNDMQFMHIERLFRLIDILMCLGMNVDTSYVTSFSYNERVQLYRLAKKNKVNYLQNLHKMLCIGDNEFENKDTI
jgi:molybdenum cofactor biosynthesis enzyme MoaA